MYTHNDLIDAILQAILPKLGASRASAAPGAPSKGARPKASWAMETGPKARRFLTKAEIRKALTPGARHLTIARDAIVSPLALDWLALNGIQIVRE